MFIKPRRQYAQDLIYPARHYLITAVNVGRPVSRKTVEARS
jgi:hypothetical protein